MYPVNSTTVTAIKDTPREVIPMLVKNLAVKAS